MIKHGLYNFIGASFRLCVTVGTIPLLIRLIGLEEYGLWTIVSTVVAIVSLAEAGLSVSTTYFLSRDLADNDTVRISETLTVSFCSILLLATVASGILWSSAEYIIYLFPKLTPSQHQIVIPAFRLGALVIWIKLLQRIFVGIEQAYQRYGLFNLINTIQVSLVNLGMLWIAYSGGLTLALMRWQLISNLLILAAHIVIGSRLLRHTSIKLIWNWKRCVEIFRYSMKTWLASIGSALFTQGDKVIIGSILGTTTLGIYSAITSITAQINAFSSLPVQPLLPHLSKLLQSSDTTRAELIKLVRQAFHINALVAIGLGGGLIALAPTILNLLLPDVNTSEYLGVFYIAIFIYTLYSINAIGYYILFSTNNVSSCLKIQIVSGILSLVLITLGAHTLALVGAVIGNAGYICTWFLIYKGMNKLAITVDTWLQWLSFISIWFFAVSFVSILIPNIFFIRIMLFTIHIIVLVSRLYLKNKTIFKLWK